MYQGETITTTVDLPVAVEQLDKLFIIFRNASRIVLEKTMDDCSITQDDEGNELLEFTLTQEESLRIPPGEIQRSVIAITKDGARFESDPCCFNCGVTTKNEVL